MVDGYTKLGLPEFADAANRVLVLNREQGNFGSDAYEKASKSLFRKFWDYIGLDED